MTFPICFSQSQHIVYCLRTHKFHFLTTFSLKMSLTILFTHLKIILLQCFSVFSYIQTDPKCAFNNTGSRVKKQLTQKTNWYLNFWMKNNHHVRGVNIRPNPRTWHEPNTGFFGLGLGRNGFGSKTDRLESDTIRNVS